MQPESLQAFELVERVGEFLTNGADGLGLGRAEWSEDAFGEGLGLGRNGSERSTKLVEEGGEMLRGEQEGWMRHEAE